MNMDKFTVVTGMVAPMDRANVDTDAIIPKQFLKSIKRTGFGPNLFDAWRYLDEGQPDKPNEGRPLNPDFVLNQVRFKGASVLVARKNFGCGSSREHAPWALQEYGFRAVLAPSFGDIFYNNSFKNGFLPIVLPEAQIDRIFNDVAAFPGFRLVIDLPGQLVRYPDGSQVFEFEVDSHRKECLINGWDDIGLTLLHSDKIRAFEEKRKLEQPWLFA